MRRMSFVFFGLVCLLAGRAFAQDRSPIKSIEPPQVYARAQLLLAELDLVREELGGPRNSRPEISVKGVEPRENYFQAVTVYRKAERLCAEQTGDAGLLLPAAPSESALRPGDVYAVLDAALAQVRQVKSHLRIPEQVTEPAADSARTPTDVFRLIVQINRQLNLLLEHEVTPTAVYQQLNLAIDTAQQLLARFPDAAAVPEPAYVRRQKPADVHARLMESIEPLKSIMTRSGSSMLDVDWKLDAGSVAPSDVFDAATLIVSELRHLEAQLPAGRRPIPFAALPPARKLPAHNVQRAGLLQAQLVELKRLVEAHPDWLKGSAPAR